MSIPAYLYTIDKSTRSTRLPTQAPIRYESVDARGSRIEADNAAPLPLDECILQTLPQQDLHGYDRPWAPGAGANQLSVSRLTTIRATIDGADDAFTVTPSSTGLAAAVYPIPDAWAGETIYIMAELERTGTHGNNIALQMQSTNTDTGATLYATLAEYVDGAASVDRSYNIPANRSNIALRIIANTGGDDIDTVTTVTRPLISVVPVSRWQPYANICPLRQPISPATLTVRGPGDVSSTWLFDTGPVWGARLDALTGEAVVNWAHFNVWDYAIHGDVPEPWISSMDVYVPGTQPTDGAEVAYEFATGSPRQDRPWDVRTYQGDNVLELTDGELTIAYTAYASSSPPAALELPIDLKEPTDVLHPTIELTLAGNPAAYNYMYIPEFDRYYWLENWTSVNLGLWSVSADVDVLASWRSQIFDLKLYVLRSAAAGDGQIIDHMYPAIADVRRQLLYTEADPWGVASGTLGLYVVSVCGSGETAYYALGPEEYKRFFGQLLGDDYVDNVMSYLPDWETLYPQAKLEINALQYIAGVKWYPLTSLPGVPGSVYPNIPVGYGTVNVPGAFKIGSLAVTTARTWTIPLQSIHPQSARGAYLDLAPYSTIHAYIPPFGVIAINPATAAASGSITATVAVDVRSGNGALRLITSDGSVETELHAPIGVSVAIGQTVAPGYGILDATGAAAGVVGGIAGAVGAAMTGNVAGAISAGAGAVGGATSAIGNAISAQIPTTRTVGSPESIGALRGPITVYSDHYMVAPEDITHRGRPLCQVRRLGDLPGYVLVADADFTLPAMSEEHDSIRAMLEGGVFIE